MVSGDGTSATPGIFSVPLAVDLCNLVSGYVGSRFVMRLGAKGPEPWSPVWMAASLASALSVNFLGGTLNAFVMMTPPRSFHWQESLNVLQALAGGLLCWLTTYHCGEGKLVDWPGSTGLGCEDTFLWFESLTLAFLVAFAAGKSWMYTLDSGATFSSRASQALLTTYMCVAGGGIVRDIVAKSLGIDVLIGNLAVGFVVPLVLSGFLHFLLLHCSPLLQLGLGIPLSATIFHLLPNYL
eukprot:TRINITY_DN31103_c0_g1_i1.p1 TRINITY_DN31103_c0_g1~~TRINITY_DN31103_c0_g1_i1.p1  ORF type:complete len:253 (+),score=31.81 TRINITY_DN31103_c0_g1_i1:45-761(+)